MHQALNCRSVDLIRLAGPADCTYQLEEQLQLSQLGLLFQESTFLTADAHDIPRPPYHLNGIVVHVRTLLGILLTIFTQDKSDLSVFDI